MRRSATLLRAAIALAALLAASAVLHQYARSPSRHARRQRIERAAVPASQPPTAAQPDNPEAARANARATLQHCLSQAQAAAQTSWNGMCAVLAQRNQSQFDACRQQGRGDSYCRSLSGSTAAQDCSLPHATADSIATAAQAAKTDCYQQFQSTLP